MLAAIVLVLVLAMTANDKLETALAALEFTADFFWRRYDHGTASRPCQARRHGGEDGEVAEHRQY